MLETAYCVDEVSRGAAGAGDGWDEVRDELTRPPLVRETERRGGVSANFLSRQSLAEALPTAKMWINGALTTTLIDTGCSRCIVHLSLCSSWKREAISVLTVSGEEYACKGSVTVSLQLSSGMFVDVDVLVVDTTPLGFAFILVV